MTRRAARAVALALIAVGTGCESSESGGAEGDGGSQIQTSVCGDTDVCIPDASDAGDAGSVGIAILDLAVVGNPANVLSAFVDYRTTEAVPTRVEVACGEEPARLVEGTEPRTEHEAVVLGLLANTTCTVTAVAEGGVGAPTRESVAYDVGALPDSFPELVVSLPASGAGEPSGWTAFALSRYVQPEVPLRVVMVDGRGRYRWVFSRGTTSLAQDNDVVVLEDGVVVGGALEIDAFLVDWAGNVVWEEPFEDEGGMDHDITPVGDAGQFLVLGRSQNGCPLRPDGVGTFGGVIFRWDPSTGEVPWRWRLCDHYTPADPRFDWSHTNAVALVPGENAVLLSSRGEHAIWKIDLGTGAIVWRLGREGDFTLADGAAEWFEWQHDPEPQPNGNVLVYDNRAFGSASSRVVELALDESAMTARIVWQYEPDPGIYTPIWGDADRLASGHTLATFGRRDAAEDSHVVEVDEGAREVWHLRTPAGWGIYRAQRLERPPTGLVVGP